MSENIENVPKIRFPGFIDAWEQRRLGDLCNEFRSGEFIKASDISPLGDYPVYGGNGIRGYANTYNHEGEFALIGRQGALCGNMRYSCGKAYFTEHAVAVSANNENDTRFSYYLLGIMNLGQYSGQSAQPGLAVGNLIRLKTMVPIKAEQSKISLLFSKLDHLITLHQRKLNNVKNLKAGLLQKMFPKDGEDFPEVRFPGFTDAWEQRELSELANFTKGSGYTKSDLREEGSPIILYGRLYTDYETLIEDVNTFVDVKENSVISLGGEVIVPSSGESAEDISRASVVGKPGIILGGDLNVIKPNEQIDPIFLALAISNGAPNKDMAKRAQGKSVVHLHNSDLQKINLDFPQIEEQRNIVEFNLHLDNLITLHQRKLEHLKEQKKALLQQMFV